VSRWNTTKEASHEKTILYVGLDVQKVSVNLAIVEPATAGETRDYGRIGGDLEALHKVTRRWCLPNTPAALRCAGAR
jgi:hypothetical protein